MIPAARQVVGLVLVLLMSAGCGAAGPASLTPWDALVGTRDDRTFIVEYSAGTCGDRFSHVTVEERSSEVLITVHQRRVPVGGDCPDIAEVRTATARLRGALGDRALLDGACRSPGTRHTPPCTRPDKADPRPA